MLVSLRQPGVRSDLEKEAEQICHRGTGYIEECIELTKDKAP